MSLDKLLEQCGSPIEEQLLNALYPRLKTRERDLFCAQYQVPIDRVRKPDFAFPQLKIAIYCDGWQYHQDKPAFHQDRSESRLLLSMGWAVLRFTGGEIKNDINGVVNEILAFLYRAPDSYVFDAADSKKSRTSSDEVGTYHKTANAYYEKGDYHNALKVYNQVIELDSNFIPAYWGRGATYAKMGNRASADEDYAMARLLEEDQSSQSHTPF